MPNSVVEQLRELERMGRENQLAEAAPLRAQVDIEFERIKRYLEEKFQPLLKTPSLGRSGICMGNLPSSDRNSDQMREISA